MRGHLLIAYANMNSCVALRLQNWTHTMEAGHVSAAYWTIGMRCEMWVLDGRSRARTIFRQSRTQVSFARCVSGARPSSFNVLPAARMGARLHSRTLGGSLALHAEVKAAAIAVASSGVSQ